MITERSSLAGKDASFQLKIKDIQERVKKVPIDDQLAKEIGEKDLNVLKKKLLKKWIVNLKRYPY